MKRQKDFSDFSVGNHVIKASHPFLPISLFIDEHEEVFQQKNAKTKVSDGC